MAVGILVVDLVISALARALWPRVASRWGLKAGVVLAGVEALRFAMRSCPRKMDATRRGIVASRPDWADRELGYRAAA